MLRYFSKFLKDNYVCQIKLTKMYTIQVHLKTSRLFIKYKFTHRAQGQVHHQLHHQTNKNQHLQMFLHDKLNHLQ
jgi:hypothetical protein